MDEPSHPLPRPREFAIRRRRILQAGGAAAAAGALGLAFGVRLAARPGAHVSLFTASAADLASPRVRVQHLLRRAGFAPTRDEVSAGLEMGGTQLIDYLTAPKTIAGKPEAPPRLHLDQSDQDPSDALINGWVQRMMTTKTPSAEKLTFFWHGWHTSGFGNLDTAAAPLLYRQLLFQRRHAVARFPDILKGLWRQPAMMQFLDLDGSVKEHPNENFARELMELFSMGAGNYSERDVREAARAFTGWSVDEHGVAVFDPDQYDTGEKEFLGGRGNFGPDEVVDAIAAHPATERFVARRVWRWFGSPGPDLEVLDAIAQQYRESGGDMGAVLRGVFRHPAFLTPESYRGLIKSPVEYLIGAIRQLELDLDPATVRYLLAAMGQEPCDMPNVSGWRGGSTWLASGAFMTRLNAAGALAYDGIEGRRLFDPGDFLNRNRLATVEDLVDYLLALFLDGIAPDAARERLIEFASGGRGGATKLSSLAADERHERVRASVAAVIASPAYQLN